MKLELVTAGTRLITEQKNENMGKYNMLQNEILLDDKKISQLIRRSTTRKI